MADLIDPSEAMNQAFLKIAGQQERQDAIYGAPTYKGAMLTASTPTVSSSVMPNIEGSLSSILNETDTQKMLTDLSALKGSVEQQTAKMRKEAEIAANTEFGLPALEQEYKKIKAIERSNPYYFQKFGDMDSAEADHIKSKMQSAMQAASASVNKRLAADPVYVDMTSRMEIAEAAAKAKISLNLNSDERKALEAEDYALRLGAEGQRNLALLDPSTAEDPRRAMLVVASKPQKERALLEQAIGAPQEEMPFLAIKGNPFARKILETKEVDSIGQGAKTLLQEGYKIADRNLDALSAFETLVKTKGHPFSTLDPKIQQQYKTILGPAGMDISQDKAQHEAQAASLRQSIAMEYMKVKNVTDFNSDITKINAPTKAMPGFLQAALQKEPRIDLARAKSLAREAPSVEAAQIQINDLAAWYGDAVRARNKSALFNIDPWEAEKLKTEAAMSRLEKFFAPIGQGLKDLKDVGNALGLPGAANFAGAADYILKPGVESLDQATAQARERLARDAKIPQKYLR